MVIVCSGPAVDIDAVGWDGPVGSFARGRLASDLGPGHVIVPQADLPPKAPSNLAQRRNSCKGLQHLTHGCLNSWTLLLPLSYQRRQYSARQVSPSRYGYTVKVIDQPCPFRAPRRKIHKQILNALDPKNGVSIVIEGDSKRTAL